MSLSCFFLLPQVLPLLVMTTTATAAVGPDAASLGLLILVVAHLLLPQVLLVMTTTATAAGGPGDASLELLILVVAHLLLPLLALMMRYLDY